MRVGDLVQCDLWGDIKGIVTQVVVDDPINPERNTVKVHWFRTGATEGLNASLLEVISASR